MQVLLKNYGGGVLWKLVLEFPIEEEVFPLRFDPSVIIISDEPSLKSASSIRSMPLAGVRDLDVQSNLLELTLSSQFVAIFMESIKADRLYFVPRSGYLVYPDGLLAVNVALDPIRIQNVIVRKSRLFV